jgi:hypothetical protein
MKVKDAAHVWLESCDECNAMLIVLADEKERPFASIHVDLVEDFISSLRSHAQKMALAGLEETVRH